LGPFAEAVRRLATTPGVDRRTAEAVVAEVGADRSRFPAGSRLAAWAGKCPRDDERGGGRRGGQTPQGSPWVRRAPGRAGGAGSTKGTYLAAFSRRLAARRGRKRALVALGHTLRGVRYQLLREGEDYADLGADSFGRRDRDRLTRRLEGLGLKVTLEPKSDV